MNCKFCKADCCSRGLNRDAAFCAGWIKMTNADRIRAMSDEELSQFLCTWHNAEECHHCVAERFCEYGHTGMIDWLKQEVTDA